MSRANLGAAVKYTRRSLSRWLAVNGSRLGTAVVLAMAGIRVFPGIRPYAAAG